jgi:hypothetical protein
MKLVMQGAGDEQTLPLSQQMLPLFQMEAAAEQLL